MPLYIVKAKVEVAIVYEAADKDEAFAWAQEVLPDIIVVDKEYAERLEKVEKVITAQKPKLFTGDVVLQKLIKKD